MCVNLWTRNEVSSCTRTTDRGRVSSHFYGHWNRSSSQLTSTVPRLVVKFV